MKKNKRIKQWIIASMLSGSMLLTGCSVADIIPQEIKSTEVQTQGETQIQSESSTLGIKQDDIDILKKLENNTYYVLHDGIYYPANYYLRNSTAEETLDISADLNPNRMIYYNTENEQDIPTLYEGDKLIYYSTDTLLDCIKWERYYDLGYSIGVTNLMKSTAGRYYIDMDETDDSYTVLPDSELYDLSQETTSQILFDKISGVQISPEIVDHGVIVGTKKDEVYDLDVYAGTYYKHFDATSNYHMFRAYELFASIEYETLQDYQYEIKIPDYFIDGYYNVNEAGLIRIVRGTSYNKDTNFNEQLLYQPIDSTITGKEIVSSTEETSSETSQVDESFVQPEDSSESIEEQIEATKRKTTDSTMTEGESEWTPSCYSEYKPLNKFTTNIEGKLGYEDPNATTETTEIDGVEYPTSIAPSIVKEFKLWFPKDKECTITIKSPSEEKTGNLVLIYPDGRKKQGKYDFFTKEYILSVNGSDEQVTLQVNGFWKGYDIELSNAVVYSNQKPTE